MFIRDRENIKIIFKKIGAAAAAANLFSVFKIPEKKDDKLTNAKKGKVILVKSTAKLNLLLSSIKPGAIKKTTYGVKISTIKTIVKSPNVNKVKTSSANLLPCALLFNFSDA